MLPTSPFFPGIIRNRPGRASRRYLSLVRPIDRNVPYWSLSYRPLTIDTTRETLAGLQ